MILIKPIVVQFFGTVFYQCGPNVTWTNQPNAVTEAFAGGAFPKRVWLDFTGMSQIRIGGILTIAGTAGAKLGIQYSDDNGVTWRGLDNDTLNAISTVTIAIDSISAVTNISSWGNIAANAKKNVLVRLAGQGGNGVDDPAFSIVYIEFRKIFTP